MFRRRPQIIVFRISRVTYYCRGLADLGQTFRYTPRGYAVRIWPALRLVFLGFLLMPINNILLCLRRCGPFLGVSLAWCSSIRLPSWRPSAGRVGPGVGSPGWGLAPLPPSAPIYTRVIFCRSGSGSTRGPGAVCFFLHTARGLLLGPVWGFPPPLRGLVWVAPRASVPCRSVRRWRPGLGRFARCAAPWSAWPGAGSPPPMVVCFHVAGKGRPGPGFPWC